MKQVASLIAAIAALLATPALAQNIDTRAAATSTISSFGQSWTHTFGQTFTVPAGQTAISNFSLRMETVPNTVGFRGVLMAWDTGTERAVGPVLYESADVSTSGATQQDVTFNIPGTAPVTAGQTYVIFVSTVNSAGVGAGAMSFTTSDVLAGGRFYFQDSTTAADWTGMVWDPFAASRDLGVTVNFIPGTPPATIPTLSEWALIGLTLTLAGAGAVFVTRRRRLA